MDLSYTIVLMFVLIVNIIVLLLKRPNLTFIVGVISLSFIALSFTDATVEIAFSPYMQVLTFFVTIYCMVQAYVQVR